MLMNTNDEGRVKLDLLYGFGTSTSKGYRDSVGILEDEGNKKILFPIAKFIGVKQVERSDMNFLKLSNNMERIQCMTISPNKKCVAICEKIKQDGSDTKRQIPSVSVYDIKQALLKNSAQTDKKHFPYAETTVENFSALSFSSDSHSRFLLCLTEAPENKLVFIDILGSKKNYASCVINATINRISISTHENHLVAISGPNCFKILRVQESSFVYMAESIKRLSQQQNFTDHCWFDEGRVALANDQGEIFTIYNNEVEQYINCGMEKLGQQITTIQSYSKGLVVGGNMGNFSLWIKDENPMKIFDRRQDEEKYELVQLKSWKSERGEEVSCIDISSNDDTMAVAFKNNDIATYDLSKVIPIVVENLDVMKRNLKNLEKRTRFQYVFKGSHGGAISSMDICLQRPLIVTCSNQDSTVRIWNYTNYKCELLRKFDVKDSDSSTQNPLLSVAFHPSGYYVAVGFVDKLRIYHVLHDSLKIYQEVQLKNVINLRFSAGGHYLAAATPKQQTLKTSQHYISVYNSYTLEQEALLKGPNNKITELTWGPKDAFLLCCSLDGQIYEYDVYKQWQKNDLLYSKSHLTSILYNENTQHIQATGYDDNKGILEEIHRVEDKITEGGMSAENSQKANQLKITVKKPTIFQNTILTKFCYLTSYFNHNGIIAGTNQGFVKVWSHNIHNNQCMPFETIPCHDGEVTNLRVSPNGRYVITTGADGIIFIFQVSELTQEGEVISAKHNSKQMVESINPRSLCTDDTLADVIMVPKFDIDNYIKEREKIKMQFEDYQLRKQEEMEDFKRKQDKMLQDLEEQKQKDIKKLQDDYNKLQNSKDMLQRESQILLDQMEESHLEQVRELDKLYEAKLAYENEKYMQQEQELQEAKTNFSKQVKDIENKNDKTLMLLKSEFVDQFSKVNKVYTSTKDTATDIKKTYEERLSQLEEEHELEISSMVNKYEELEKLKTDQLGEKQKIITNLVKEKNQANQLKEKYENEVQKHKETIESLENKIDELDSNYRLEEQEKLKKEGIVKEKDKSINNLKYKISDLQKTKHVLSFRTTEMRKSLEPKEAQIEKLKEELFKLENEFQAILKNYQLQNDKMKKMQNQIDTLNNNLNAETVAKKKVESLNNKIIMDIYNTVKKNDINEYVIGMKYLYQEYVQELQIHQGKQDPKSIEEIGRMVGQLEKSIFQINKSTGKVIIRREKEIHKKTKENAELIYDLNDIRKENKELKAELSNLRILHETSEKENRKLEDSNKKLEKMVDKKKLTQSQSQADNLDKYNPFAIGNQMDAIQSSQPILNQKGKVVKGSNFDIKTLGTFDKAKMMDLMAEVELNAQRRGQVEETLLNVRRKIKEHLESCEDAELQKECLVSDPKYGGFGDSLGGIRLPSIQRN